MADHARKVKSRCFLEIEQLAFREDIDFVHGGGKVELDIGPLLGYPPGTKMTFDVVADSGPEVARSVEAARRRRELQVDVVEPMSVSLGVHASGLKVTGTPMMKFIGMEEPAFLREARGAGPPGRVMYLPSPRADDFFLSSADGKGRVKSDEPFVRGKTYVPPFRRGAELPVAGGTEVVTDVIAAEEGMVYMAAPGQSDEGLPPSAVSVADMVRVADQYLVLKGTGPAGTLGPMHEDGALMAGPAAGMWDPLQLCWRPSRYKRGKKPIKFLSRLPDVAIQIIRVGSYFVPPGHPILEAEWRAGGGVVGGGSTGTVLQLDVVCAELGVVMSPCGDLIKQRGSNF